MAVKVQLLDCEEPVNALPLIYGKSNGPEYLTEAYTPVKYHNKYVLIPLVSLRKQEALSRRAQQLRCFLAYQRVDLFFVVIVLQSLLCACFCSGK